MMPDGTKFEAELRKARKSGGGMRDIRIESWEQEKNDEGTTRSRKRKSDQMDVGRRKEDSGKKRRKSSGKVRATTESEDDVVEILSAKKGKPRARPLDLNLWILVYERVKRWLGGYSVQHFRTMKEVCTQVYYIRLYGVGVDYQDDVGLVQKRTDIIHLIAVIQEKCGLLNTIALADSRVRSWVRSRRITRC